MIPLPYKLLAAFLAAAAILAAVLGYGHRQYSKGYKIATTEANTRIDRQKLDAAAVLIKETARANTAEHVLQDFKNQQELKDVDHQKIVTDLADRLERSKSVGRLRDPNAAPGCRLGSSGTTSKITDSAVSGSNNDTEIGGLFSARATELFERLTREADEVNVAYESCRNFALKVIKE